MQTRRRILYFGARVGVCGTTTYVVSNSRVVTGHLLPSGLFLRSIYMLDSLFQGIYRTGSVLGLCFLVFIQISIAFRITSNQNTIHKLLWRFWAGVPEL